MNVSFLCHYSFLPLEKHFYYFTFSSHSLSSKFPYAHRLFLSFPSYITIFGCFTLILSRNIENTNPLGSEGSPPDLCYISSTYSKSKRMQRLKLWQKISHILHNQPTFTLQPRRTVSDVKIYKEVIGLDKVGHLFISMVLKDLLIEWQFNFTHSCI